MVKLRNKNKCGVTHCSLSTFHITPADLACKRESVGLVRHLLCLNPETAPGACEVRHSNSDEKTSHSLTMRLRLALAARILCALSLVAAWAFPLASVSLAAPSEVWVDDGYTPSTPGWGVTHFSVIAGGILAWKSVNHDRWFVINHQRHGRNVETCPSDRDLRLGHLRGSASHGAFHGDGKPGVPGHVTPRHIDGIDHNIVGHGVGVPGRVKQAIALGGIGQEFCAGAQGRAGRP